MNNSNFKPSPFTIDDVNVISEDEVYHGYGKVTEFTFTHRLFDGGFCPPVTREIYSSGDAVVVIPYDPVSDTVLLIEQIRMGPLARKDRPWVIEALAGRIEPGEEPEDVARRESIEEAGCTLIELERAGSFFQSPGIFAEKITYFCGLADLSQAGGIYGLDHEGEDIRAVVAPLSEAVAAIGDGRMVSGPTVLCLLWLEANSARLREKWAC